MLNYFQRQAEKIPEIIRKTLINKGIIDRANVNITEKESDMGFLFDIYEEYLDPKSEHDDWNCPKCKNFILSEFKEMKKYIEAITNL